MGRTRIRTTVDGDVLTAVRERRPGATDSAVIEEALTALLGELERTEIEAAYRDGYDRLPFDLPDAWGDLASFGRAAGAS